MLEACRPVRPPLTRGPEAQAAEEGYLVLGAAQRHPPGAQGDGRRERPAQEGGAVAGAAAGLGHGELLDAEAVVVGAAGVVEAVPDGGHQHGVHEQRDAPAKKKHFAKEG